MSPRPSTRYCASPSVNALLRKDGLGWGHDLDCGCFHVEADRATHRLRRAFVRMTGRA